MYERFTDRARKCFLLANQEAHRLNHDYIGVEHLLLGLLKEGSGLAAAALIGMGADYQAVREALSAILIPGPEKVMAWNLPHTPRLKSVVGHAVEEASGFQHNYVGTEHLLLGLLREQEGCVAQVLTNLNLKFDEIREEVLRLLGKESPESPSLTEGLRVETASFSSNGSVVIGGTLEVHFKEGISVEDRRKEVAHFFRHFAWTVDDAYSRRLDREKGKTEPVNFVEKPDWVESEAEPKQETWRDRPSLL